jgi:CheY-like chemotaxis protein
MDPIDLTNIDKDEKARLLTSYRDGTAGKTIIYVEDRPELGKPTSQLLQAYAPSADLRWVKTADDALELVNEIKAKDPNAPKKMIVITDDDTQSAMDGSHLIKTLSQDKTWCVLMTSILPSPQSLSIFM